MTHDACIHKLLDVVKAQEGTCLCEINSDEAIPEDERKVLGDRFVKACQWITNGFIASQLFGALLTVQVGKQLELSLCYVGACICQLVTLLSSLDTANEGAYIQCDFPVWILRGNIQTGHKYGHHNVCYVEYMTTAIETLLITDGVQNYLNHGTFIKDKHAKKVRAIMDT